MNITFEKIESIQNELDIYDNEKLTSLSFPALLNTQIFRIDSNPMLKNFNGFESLQSIGYLDIRINESIPDLNAFNSINHLSHLTLSGNSNLTSLNGLSNLTEVSGEIFISDNDSLTSLNGFEKLTSAGADFSIHGNQSLLNFCAILNLVIDDGIVGELFIFFNEYNPTIQDFIDGNCSL